jgi:dTDP-4-dehydrorhamnose reductase
MTGLIIGASGQVGSSLYKKISDLSVDVVGTYMSHPVNGLEYLDIRDEISVKNLITRVNPDFVCVPASLTNVDYCELHPDESRKINVQGLKNIADAVKEISSDLIYFSSDYVFDGINGPYLESDMPNPICEYGKQKLIAEKYIENTLKKFLICRTTVVYSWEIQGKNFVQRLIRTLRDGMSIKVPADQIGTPTYAPNLAEAVIHLIDNNKYGAFNVAGPDLLSRYEFAKIIAKEFGLNENLIQGIETKYLNQPAKRPLNGGLVITKLQENSDIEMIGCINGLRLMKNNIITDTNE